MQSNSSFKVVVHFTHLPPRAFRNLRFALCAHLTCRCAIVLRVDGIVSVFFTLRIRRLLVPSLID